MLLAAVVLVMTYILGAPMQKPKVWVWSVTGGIVGAFVMPSTWLLLIYLTAGRAALDAFSGAGEPLLIPDPDGGFGLPVAPEPSSTPGWLTALLIVSVVVTLLSAAFFGWVGYRLATNARQHAPAL